MQRLIKDLWRQRGTTIVFVTHNIDEAVRLSTRVIALGEPDVLDTAVPKVDADSSEEQLRLFIRKIETRITSDINVSADRNKFQKRRISEIALQR
jgi:ABC-type nitrate/sulfonate/bicarbonate transport system ATPase subunit